MKLESCLTIRNIVRIFLLLTSYCSIFEYAIGQTPDNWIHKIDSIYFRNTQVKALVTLPDSSIWIFSSSGVYSVIDIDHAPSKISSLDISMPVDINHDKTIAYALGDTVFICNFSDFCRDTFTHFVKIQRDDLPYGCFKDRPKRASLNISCLKFDHKERCLWIGTNINGLIKLSTPKLNERYWNLGRRFFIRCDRNSDSGFSNFISNDVKNVFIDKQNRKWIQFDRGLGIIETDDFFKIFDNYTVQYLCENIHRGQYAIWAVVNGVKGIGNQMMILSADSISDIINQSKQCAPLAEFKNEIISDFLVDHDGDIWGCTSNLLFRKKELGLALSVSDAQDKLVQNQAAYFSYTEGLTSVPFCIEEDLRGIIWIGTFDNGVYFLRKTVGIECTFVDSIHCHDEKNAKLRISAVEGKSPFKLIWESNVLGNGIKKNFKDTMFTDLGEGTLQFTVIDNNNDSDKIIVKVDNPSKIKAKIEKQRWPSYEDYMDGVVEAPFITGGRPYYGYEKWYKGYKVAVNDTSHLSRNFDYVGVGFFNLHIVDRRGCLLTIRDSFSRPERFFHVEGPCGSENPIEYESSYLEFKDYKFELDGDSHAVLDQIVEVLKNCSAKKLLVTGYVKQGFKPDKGETAESLSKKRAMAACEYIVKKGITSDRLRYKGGGEGTGKKVVFKFN